MLAAPYVVGRLSSDTTQVADAHLVPSQLDVLVVTDGSPHRAEVKPPPSPALGEFNVTYSVGYAAGDQFGGHCWTTRTGWPRSTRSPRVGFDGYAAPTGASTTPFGGIGAAPALTPGSYPGARFAPIGLTMPGRTSCGSGRS